MTLLLRTIAADLIKALDEVERLKADLVAMEAVVEQCRSLRKQCAHDPQPTGPWPKTWNETLDRIDAAIAALDKAKPR